MASRGDVKAVRKVLYSRKRLRKMLTEIRSIDILMNTNPDAALPSDDIRVTAGSGPVWFILQTGAVDPGVLEAAERSRRVAALLRDARRELKDVDFDRDDKRELRNALDEHAAALIARAHAWSMPQAENAATAAARMLAQRERDELCNANGCPGFDPASEWGPCKNCATINGCQCCPDASAPTGYTYCSSLSNYCCGPNGGCVVCGT